MSAPAPAGIDPAYRPPFGWWHELVLLALLAALLGFAAWRAPGFLAPEAQLGLTRGLWPMALVALPMTAVILTGGIDLSVGSIMALAAVTLGLARDAGAPVGVAALAAVLAAVAAGALNGVFVAYVRVHPLIVTLATLAAYRGLAEGLSVGRSYSGYPAAFTWIGQGEVGSFGAAGASFGVPVPALLFAALAIAAAVVVARTPFGLSLHAIGHNETASRWSGIPVARTKLLLYAASGLVAGLAEVVYAAKVDSAKADHGDGIELDVITAVVLGGTSIFGGRGGIAGTVLGILVIHEVRQFVAWHWEKDELNAIVVGALLVLAVLANALLTPRARRD